MTGQAAVIQRGGFPVSHLYAPYLTDVHPDRVERMEKAVYILVASAFLCLCLSGCGESPSPVAPTPQPPSPPSATPQPPPTVPPPPGLLGQVVPGGYVIFFRHASRDSDAISTEDLAIADSVGACKPGSELTAEGVAEAVAIGATFTRHGMKADKVYNSPTCRTDQMASLAFGEHEPRRELTYPGMWTDEEKVTLTPKLRELLGTKPADGTSIVLISHGTVLVADRIGTTVNLGQADAAVFRPLGSSTFEFVGVIPKSEWLR
jgi:broad specificity phosphatase PhoE